MNKWSSAFEKMNWMQEEELFFVVCEAPRTEDPPVDADGHVGKRVRDHLKEHGYALIHRRDLDSLNMMYGVDWNEVKKCIYRHKTKNVYTLLYWGALLSAAKNAIKNLPGKKISVPDNHYQSCPGNAHVEILTIMGVKPNGHPVRCDFVDAKIIISSFATSHGARGNARV